MITSADCVKCGACCVSLFDQDRYCDVTEEDEQRLGKKFVRLHVLREKQSIGDRLADAVYGRTHVHGAIATKWTTQKTGPLKTFDLCTFIIVGERSVGIRTVALVASRISRSGRRRGVMITDPIGPLNEGERNCVRILMNMDEAQNLIHAIKEVLETQSRWPADLVRLRDGLQKSLDYYRDEAFKKIDAIRHQQT